MKYIVSLLLACAVNQLISNPSTIPFNAPDLGKTHFILGMRVGEEKKNKRLLFAKRMI